MYKYFVNFNVDEAELKKLVDLFRDGEEFKASFEFHSEKECRIYVEEGYNGGSIMSEGIMITLCADKSYLPK